jgi:hypothetical protein
MKAPVREGGEGILFNGHGQRALRRTKKEIKQCRQRPDKAPTLRLGQIACFTPHLDLWDLGTGAETDHANSFAISFMHPVRRDSGCWPISRQPLIWPTLSPGFVGPFGMGWVKSGIDRGYLELGLIFMLFMIGLEIDLKRSCAGKVILFAAGGN